MTSATDNDRQGIPDSPEVAGEHLRPAGLSII
jgi:hypothetical protein